jgi:hypothetical protein
MPECFELDHDGHRHVVVHGDGELRYERDGELVETASVGLRPRCLGDEEDAVDVFVWRGRVRSVNLVEGRMRFTFDGPPGSPAARRFALQQSRPALYAARHVAFAIARVLATVAGVGAIVNAAIDWIFALFPHVELPHVDLPDIDLPDINWPHIDPPHIDLPGWVKAVLSTDPYWVPVIVAVVIARRELRRRREVPQEPED